jgi:predicted secreted protein
VAKFVATDYKITIGGTDFSTSLAAATLDISAEEQDTTAFGAAGGYRTRIAGLKDASLTLDFHQDFGAGAVDATLFPLLGTQATVTIVPTSGTVSAINPSYQGVFLVTQYQPYASSVGDLATLSVSWPLASGGITRGTGA